jgi:hypothetical protein
MKLSNAADQPRSMVLLFLDVLPKSFGRAAKQLSNASIFQRACLLTAHRVGWHTSATCLRER